MKKENEQEFTKFHCHIYYDKNSVEIAREIYNTAKEDFSDLYVGVFLTDKVGPHLKWNFQISFESKDFWRVNNWLMNYRNGLSVLVHANTGYDLADHTERCFWYGENIGLDKTKLDPDPI